LIPGGDLHQCDGEAPGCWPLKLLHRLIYVIATCGWCTVARQEADITELLIFGAARGPRSARLVWRARRAVGLLPARARSQAI
jgi:hypothetical protein